MKIKLKRLVAGYIDFIICCLLGTSISKVITLRNNNFTFISVSIYAISTIIFIILKDIVFKNASIGKWLFKLEIVKTDETKLRFVDIIKRNVLYIILIPLEVLLLIIHDKRIGDLLAKTLVVSKIRGRT